MAEAVGFEPTDPEGPPVFKTGAINLALPRLKKRGAAPPLGTKDSANDRLPAYLLSLCV